MRGESQRGSGRTDRARPLQRTEPELWYAGPNMRYARKPAPVTELGPPPAPLVPPAPFPPRRLDNGIYLAPFQFEAAFLSSAHSDEDIEKTVARESLGNSLAPLISADKP